MYKLTTFAGVTLPTARPKHTAGTAQSELRMLQTMGGVYDGWGTARARALLPFELRYECLALGTTAAALKTTLDALRALRGVQGSLVRSSFTTPAVTHWATARLTQVEYGTEARHRHGLYQPLTLTWLVTTLWHGTAHGEVFEEDAEELPVDDSNLTLVNGGNVYTDDVVITLDSGLADVTGLTIQVGSSYHLVYDATIKAGNQLVIDCSPARLSVTNGGMAAWADLTLGAYHASEAWLRLAPGNNLVTAWLFGSGAKLNFAYSDLWE